MSENSELSKYFGSASNQSAGSPFDNIGFRQLEKSDELQKTKEEPPPVSTLFQASGGKNNDAANFFDMISGGIADLQIGSKIADSSGEGISIRPRPGPLNNRDRSRAAWIPSDATRRVLIAMISSPPGTYTHNVENLTMPAVVLTEDLIDPVTKAVSYFLGPEEASKRKVLLASSVTQDTTGLSTLIEKGFYRAAVNLTGVLLKPYKQYTDHSKHTIHSIQLWFTRLSLLVKMRSFSIASVEAEPFGDMERPDLFFQFYPDFYGGRLGSLVPFGFRLLIAQIPMFINQPQICLARLHKILATVRKMLANLENGLLEDGSPGDLKPAGREEALSIWRHRETLVLHNIVNCALRFKDFTLAIEVMNVLLTKTKDERDDAVLKSALGRIMLQIGDIQAAERFFQPLQKMSDPNCQTRILIDSGLFHAANGRFIESLHVFEKALKIEPNNVTVLNNMAACLLYLGRLKDAVVLLENGLKACPSLALNESYILNLSYLYDLQSVNSKGSKLNLLALISQYRGDNVHMACLRLDGDV